MNKIFKKAVAIVLVLTTALSFNITAFAESIGSNASDPSVGKDEAQGVITEYQEIVPNYDNSVVGTDVYLTNDTENVLVSVPKKVVLSGTYDPVDKKYKGKYTVKVEGDFAGEKSVNIVPESTVNLIQQGKKNIVANITQDKTQFWFTDITNGTNTSNGMIEADGLTAGSWKGVFNFNVSLENGYKYYSTLEKAVNDANNLTTENADVKEADKNTAVAAMWVNPVDNVARIQLINNSENTPELTLIQNTRIDLMQHTIKFIDGSGLISEKNLAINNGFIIGHNVSSIIKHCTEKSLFKLDVDNVEINNLTDHSFTDKVFPISSNGGNIRIHNLKLLSNQANDFSMVGLKFNNENAVVHFNNVIMNITSTGDGGNRQTDRGFQVLGILQVDGYKISMTSEKHAVWGGMVGPNSANADFDNVNLNLNAKNATSQSVGLATYGLKTIINNPTITFNGTTGKAVGLYHGSEQKDNLTTVNGAKVNIRFEQGTNGAAGIASMGKNNLIVNSTAQRPIDVISEYSGLQTSSFGQNIINGGTYKSNNHTGYIMGNAEIHDAIFECTGNNGFGFYCGGPHNRNYYNSNKVNIYNSKIIGNPASKSCSGICTTWNVSDNGYVGPREINLYDTEVYAGGGRLFYYNVNINEYDSQKVNKCTTEFHLYGNSKIYDKNKNEITKDELKHSIDTWKTTVRGQETPYYVYFGNSIIDGRGWYDATTQTSKCWNTPEANVYDHRPANKQY